MTDRLSSALAPAFDWTSNGAGADGSITIGGTTYPLTVPSLTDARMVLGTTPLAPPTAAAAGTDFARYVAAWMTYAVAATGRTITCTVGSDARLTFAIDSGVFTFSFHATTLQQLLNHTGGTGVASAAGQGQPQQLALFVSALGTGWAPQDVLAARETGNGASFGLRAGVRRETDEVVFGFIPATNAAAVALGSPATAWQPDDAYLTSLGAHVGWWSVRDVVYQALGRTCALSRDFQAVRASTLVGYDLVSLAGEDLARPKVRLQRARWTQYLQWTARFYRLGATPVATRT